MDKALHLVERVPTLLPLRDPRSSSRRPRPPSKSNTVTITTIVTIHTPWRINPLSLLSGGRRHKGVQS